MGRTVNLAESYNTVKASFVLHVIVNSKVTIVRRYIFLRFWLKTHFVSTKFCDLYAEMVQDRHIVVFYSACS